MHEIHKSDAAASKFEQGNTESAPPPAKRLRTGQWPAHIHPAPSKSSKNVEAACLDSDSHDEYSAGDEAVPLPRTELESALPNIEVDKSAIAAYEAAVVTEGRERLEATDHENDYSPKRRLIDRRWQRGRNSIYVDAFNLALKTVLDDESHLFDDVEKAVFQHWSNLSYEAQFLYVRLFLRKTAGWHRVGKLTYAKDIGDMQSAIAELQQFIPLPTPRALPEDVAMRACRSQQEVAFGTGFAFADKSEDCINDLENASSLLLLDELKALAKDAKVQGRTKKELLASFRRASGSQTALGFSSKHSEKEDRAAWTDDSSKLSTSGKMENRDSYWVTRIMDATGPCIRLSLPALRLFERVHLVFYRSNEWTEKSLTTIILASTVRRNFPKYIVSRSANIFPTRAMLLEFEAAIRTQFRIDSILEFNGTPSRDDLQEVVDIFDEVYPRWQTLLLEEQQKEDSIYASGEGAYLRRLSPAWVYTRIVHKGAYVLGKLKLYKREYDVLCELLAQRLFHTNRRGDWYQRKALIEEHYIHNYPPQPPGLKTPEAKKRHWKQVALQTCETALADQLTHIIFHRDLQKRTSKLEKSLKLPRRHQHDFTHVLLKTALERTFYGVRIERTFEQTNSGQHVKPSNRGSKTIWIDPAPSSAQNTNGTIKATAKVTEVECSVEQMCLSCYRAQGWKGVHSEGGIMRTLFACLFYDVLFLYIPNVFQTAFQTCPLDLHTDAFYPSRLSEVNARLNEISNGDAVKLVQSFWDAHADRKTCVVGFDWSYDLSDLLEIVVCFPSAALSTVMQVIAQEYGQRGGGVPDLFLWRLSKDLEGRGEVMFAEIKSENDRLSDTQRMWIDVLLGAGINVELCHAVASEIRKPLCISSALLQPKAIIK